MGPAIPSVPLGRSDVEKMTGREGKGKKDYVEANGAGLGWLGLAWLCFDEAKMRQRARRRGQWGKKNLFGRLALLRSRRVARAGASVPATVRLETKKFSSCGDDE